MLENEPEKLMNHAVAEGIFPGGILLAARRERIFMVKPVGMANLFTRKPVTDNTFFDLASLTKPLATTLAVMYLCGKSFIDLDDPVSGILPALAHAEKADITFRHLLAHTAGLPDYRPYYRELLLLPPHLRKPTLHRLLAEEPLVNPVGENTVYSDVGFLLLQWAIETVAGMPLDRFVSGMIYSPLSIPELFFNPDNDSDHFRENCAATEKCPDRGVIEGIVHDENAWVIGGVGGHAGLFGTARGVHRLLIRLLDEYAGESSFFGPGIVHHFLSRPIGADRALGFDAPSPEGSSCGKYFNRHHTVGHLGYTGTSFWMDTENGEMVILLTNRVHPTRANMRIRSFRPVIHDAVMSLIKPGVDRINQQFFCL